MKKKLNWRLGKLPTPLEVQELVKASIITQEEAREVLFSEETEQDRDKKSLESEIKFLRELVSKLSISNPTIIENIRYIEKSYQRYDWYKPYAVWCGTSIAGTAGSTSLTNGINSIVSAGTYNCNFSDIKTF